MFYFIVYEYINFEMFFKECKVIDEHPITWYNKNKDNVLLNWKQISEDEYNMWEEK